MDTRGVFALAAAAVVLLAGIAGLTAWRWARAMPKIPAATPKATAPLNESPPPATHLPFNPFAHAKEGDWATYIELVGANKAPIRIYTWTVLSSDAESVNVRVGDSEVEGPTDEFYADSRFKKTVELDAFEILDKMPLNEGSPEVADVTVEKHEVGGKEFLCNKVTTLDHASKKDPTVVWLSPEVVGPGIVGMLCCDPAGKAPLLDIRLLGYGRADGSKWGQSRREFFKARTKSPR